MTEIENLHRKVRHYCLDSFDFWSKKYQEASRSKPQTFEYTYEKGDYDIFPRCQALEALLQGVEEVNPKSINSIDEAKFQIIKTALSIETIFTKDNHGTAKNVIEDERRKFKLFVESMTTKDLENVPELFYRRKLTLNQFEKWKEKLKQTEKVSFLGFWYPEKLIKENLESYLIFDEDEILEEEESKLNQIIKNDIGNKFLIFNEDDTAYELEKESFDIYNINAESYLTDKDFNWLIYYSHEDFYIIKSEILKRKIIEVFPELSDNMNIIVKNKMEANTLDISGNQRSGHKLNFE